MNKRKGIFSSLFIILVLIFVYLPIVSLVVFSFNGTETRYGSITHWNFFSFMWYQKLFTNSDIIRSVLVTFGVGIIATVVSTIIGTLAAYSLSKAKKRFRNITLNATNIPIVTPEIITAMALFIMFASTQITDGLWRLILAHISFCTPYVVVTVYPKAAEIDQSVVDAAADLGATPIKVLTKVVLPQLKTGIIAGASIAFAMSFDDFIISYFVGGSYQNLSAYIYSLKGTINPTVNALSTIMLVFVFGKIFYDYYFQGKRKKVEEE